MTVARIHSIETMGLVDGPGIRFVVFMQGCKLRCLYCHNPDTWSMSEGEEISSIDLLNKVKRYKIYFKNSGGGVTLSGGDPLLQPEFVEEFFRMCKAEGIHTCLDTAGYGLGNYENILKYTDLVLLDIKHIDDKKHKCLTGQSMEESIKFIETLKNSNTKVWIRHVVVEGYTDSAEHVLSLAKYIDTIPNVERIDFLPYHTHGVNKYKELGINYRLDGLKPFKVERLEDLKKILEDNINDSIQIN
ncbi:pyruvate formate-lyase-activating protein [Clostridium cylindrosporum]|uniref:Pyruvate formate-lyase-activating enzyme n=1 Tax=Clostridium cylindrosporum DSM 605 TaxID=1121307 RepID=A0A0J8DEL1_CLOCY|nr:pyruvate formate-lyase-activating protein [Clostridium cylindrosporum]KMT22623.1 pyruvate formate-lyase-activating enzyme [Clostridium cylindrosporum DSM 605]